MIPIITKQGRINGFVTVSSKLFEDERGFLTRIFDDRFFSAQELPVHWTEISHHHTSKKGVLRGLYVQRHPFSEGKLLRVITGEMLWVSVDVRSSSPTFGQWDSVVLSGEKKNVLCTARGLAHGCLSLTDRVDLIIHSDNFFSEDHGVGIVWNDPTLKIDWQLDGVSPFISARDREYQSFQSFMNTNANVF